eukprot:261596_1
MAGNDWNITCFDPLPWSMLIWGIMNLCTCFLYLFGSYLLYLIWTKMGKGSRNSFQMTLIKCICTTIVIFFMVSTLSLSIHLASSFYCIYAFKTWLNAGLVALFFYQIGISLLYILFVIRLHYSFQKTTLKTSNILFIIFIIGFLFEVVLGFMVMIFFDKLPPDQWHWAQYSMIANQTTNLLFTIILLSAFVKKMLLLKDQTLLQKVIRVIICASMGLLSSNIPSIISIIRSIVGDNEFLFTAHLLLLSVDQTLNLFSMYLQFPFGDKTFKTLCGKLEKICFQSNDTDIATVSNVITTNSVNDTTNTLCTTNTTKGMTMTITPHNNTNSS